MIRTSDGQPVSASANSGPVGDKKHYRRKIPTPSTAKFAAHSNRSERRHKSDFGELVPCDQGQNYNLLFEFKSYFLETMMNSIHESLIDKRP